MRTTQDTRSFVTTTRSGIAYDRAGPIGGPAVVLIHAGIADRRMWDAQWHALIPERDVVRIDLRGYGDSVERPAGKLVPADDVIDTLDELGVSEAHLIGASFGAGVAVEVALTRPSLVASLLLSAPGGSLIPEMTPQLAAFVAAEDAALESGDLDAAVEANLSWWIDGVGRNPERVDAGVRAFVATMQRRAFELTGEWHDVDEAELDPPALDRLGEIAVPTLVLVGDSDLDAIHEAADRSVAGIADSRRIDWADVAHLPSMERPADFTTLVDEWLGTRTKAR